MAGGTGGHIYPALAVAQLLQSQGCDCFWLGTAAGMEARVVPAAGLPLSCISFAGLRGKGVWTLLLAPLRIAVAVWQALGVVRRLRPDVVLGLGGFASGPGGVAAWVLRRPLLIHEQNAISGMTNRVLARLATQVLEAFPDTFSDRRKVLTVGNPVRADLLAVAAPAQRFAGRQGPLRLLIMGGSLGAVALNEWVPKAVALLPAAQRPQILHQSGRNRDVDTAANYRAAGVTAETVAFIDDVAARYAWADLVLCRAGALTIAELAAVGVGAILVPYPHAVDDHQTANARYLADHGAAQVLQQSGLNAASLQQLLQPYVNDVLSGGRRRLLAMAEAARARAVNDATAQVARQCSNYLPQSGSSREVAQ